MNVVIRKCILIDRALHMGGNYVMDISRIRYVPEGIHVFLTEIVESWVILPVQVLFL
jgi:hypothetical protein